MFVITNFAPNLSRYAKMACLFSNSNGQFIIKTLTVPCPSPDLRLQSAVYTPEATRCPDALVASHTAVPPVLCIIFTRLPLASTILTYVSFIMPLKVMYP